MPNRQFFSYIMARKSLFNEMISIPALQYSSTPSWILLGLAHWNKSPRETCCPFRGTFSWFRANRSLHFLIYAACLVEKQQIPILESLFRVFNLTIWLELKLAINHTRGEYANHYTTGSGFRQVQKRIGLQLVNWIPITFQIIRPPTALRKKNLHIFFAYDIYIYSLKK